MNRDQSFDEFYHATRRALVHQTFALTGDLPAAQRAVRDSFTAAWHHWRKVEACEDPLDWVRPRAWQFAQRRHTARLWQRTRGTSAETKTVLDALSKLPVSHRRVLLLTQLAGVPIARAAQEIGISLETAERYLQAATANFAVHLDVDSTSIRGHLAVLSDATEEVSLPRASIIRRAGTKRRQSHTLVATAAAAAVALASGVFVYQPDVVQADETPLTAPQVQLERPRPSDAETQPTAEELLDEDQIRRLGMAQDWTASPPRDNTTGEGINTICQQTRFADPDGLSAYVRDFQAQGEPGRSAVQTIETSRSAAQAQAAFATTVGWYAGCQVGRLQLLDAYQVNGIGDQANVLMIRVWKKPVTTYSVAVGRVGRVVTSTVGKTVGAESPPPRQITQSLADSVSMLCATAGSQDCLASPEFTRVAPPPSGEERGILAGADLPPVGRIDEPWVGTDAQRARVNPSATVCDRANFVRAGAEKTRTRTFLIPGAKLPSRFGLSETYGVFGSTREASVFLEDIRDRVANCEDDHLATDVRSEDNFASAGLDATTWDLETEVSERESVTFRLGFVRVRNMVAEVNFAPTVRNDVSGKAFRDLVARAGDRLRELQ